MDTSQAHSVEVNDRLARWSLFLGITIWFIHLNAFYALPSLACQWAWFSFTIFGLSGLVVIEAIISLAALLLMLLMIYLPWRSWRLFQTARPGDNPRLLSDTESDRRSLFAFIAMLLNSFFLLFIITTLVPVVTLNACARG